MTHINHPTPSSAAPTAGEPVADPSSSGAAQRSVRLSSTPPSPALRAAAQAGRGEAASLELQAMRGSGEAGAAEPTVPEVDTRLTTILQTYQRTEKHRTIDDGAVLAFVQEQQRQLARPEDKRDWTQARRLYLAIHGVDDAKIKQIEGGRFQEAGSGRAASIPWPGT